MYGALAGTLDQRVTDLEDLDRAYIRHRVHTAVTRANAEISEQAAATGRAYRVLHEINAREAYDQQAAEDERDAQLGRWYADDPYDDPFDDPYDDPYDDQDDDTAHTADVDVDHGPALAKD